MLGFLTVMIFGVVSQSKKTEEGEGGKEMRMGGGGGEV